MTSFEATAAAAQSGSLVPGSLVPAAGVVRFRGAAGAFWRLVARGAVLLMVTLGIYRFWLTTDIRRNLWSNTELNGESFEYAGTARELLLGFLIAVAILLPLYAGFFFLALAAGTIGQLAGAIAFLVLTVLGHYAVYRARRYRLTRTIYRGVRFHQTGSAWRYAVCALFWWSLILLTLGLAYPLAQSRLERFKMGHTFFGNLPGRFEGSAWHLFLRGFVLWFLAVVPFTAGIVATLAAIDWDAVKSFDDLSSWLETSGLAGAVVYATLTGLWLLLSFAILYPIFQAMLLRWWASGLRFGSVALTSRLRTGQVYGVYARFVWYAFLFTVAAGVLVIVGAVALTAVIGDLESTAKEIATTVAGLAAYVAIALGYSTIYQATVRLGLWRCVVESLDISNLSALEQVSAAGEAASPVGEGLADALRVGGI
jgi:uncharacterized membrane protein YjgN (DUF898 family)